MQGSPIDLTGRIPGWSAAARRHWIACLRRVDGRLWSDYPPPLGHPPLRAALARQLGAQPDDVVVVTGIRPALQLQAREHGTVVLERPTFQGVVAAVRAVGAPVVRAEWGAPLLGALRSCGVGRALGVVTSPWRNPDGRTIGESFAAGLAAAVELGQTVVVNETYRFAASAAGEPEGPAVPGAVYVGSLSKVAGGGARVGWVRGADAVSSLGGTGPLWAHPPLAWQQAWADFLDEGGLCELAQEFHHRPALSAAAFLRAVPPPVRCAVVGQGAFLLLKLRVDEDTALTRLATSGVLAGPGRDFETGYHAVRLAFTRVSPAAAIRAAAAVGRCAYLFETP